MPIGAIAGPLIGAAGSLLGGLFGQSAQNRNAERNIALQKQFAQEGIQWKVEDAKKAGVHPLYALGANTTSYQPVSVGDSIGPALADMGQDLGRAVTATRGPDDRMYDAKVKALDLQHMELRNELMASEIARNYQPSVGPGIPVNATGRPPVTIDDPLFGSVRMPGGLTADELQGQIGELGDWMTGARYIESWLRAHTPFPLNDGKSIFSGNSERGGSTFHGAP